MMNRQNGEDLGPTQVKRKNRGLHKLLDDTAMSTYMTSCLL